jgi:hypothetical protein
LRRKKEEGRRPFDPSTTLRAPLRSGSVSGRRNKEEEQNNIDGSRN